MLGISAKHISNQMCCANSSPERSLQLMEGEVVTYFSVALGSADSFPLLSDRETVQDSRTGDLTPHTYGWDRQDLHDRTARISQHEILEVRNMPVIFEGDDSFLENYFCLNQVAVPESHSRAPFPHLLSSHVGSDIHSLNNVYNVLRGWGEYALADRIAYFASDQDLEEEDIPVTPESVRGFLAFFGAVTSEGRISLTCSPEGWLCAVWRFSDERRASLWFLDANRVMFSATDATGIFIEIDGGGEVGNSREVMAKLVEAGLLAWHADTLTSGNFYLATPLPGTVVNGILRKMEYQWKERFDSEKTSVTSPLTGWSTFTEPTGHSRLPASSSL